MEFFRHCPECGRRFHIKLETKKMVTSRAESIRTIVPSAVGVRSAGMGARAFTAIAVQEGKPIIIDVEEFQYAYKCQHCGHEWSEKHVEEHKIG